MKRNFISVIITIFVLVGFILFLNTSIENNNTVDNQTEAIAKVLTIDDSELILSGVSPIGCQWLDVEIIKGDYKGETVKISNNFMGQLEFDEYYCIGDKILVALKTSGSIIETGVAIDHVRHNYIIILFGIFAVFLLIYAKGIGLRALISFVVSLVIIWVFLIPCLLSGMPPIATTFITLIFLSAVILFSIAGFSKKAFSAFLGTLLGISVPVALALIFGKLLNLDGLSSPYVGNLMIKGYPNLDYQQILYSAILIGASGACMDISMDVSTSMNEIRAKKPDISRKELISSGITIGRDVIGTMATTLLLAYSGSYLTLMMLFRIMNTSLIRVLNLKIFAAEIMRIVIGSTALLFVAPITAIIAGYVLTCEMPIKQKCIHFAKSNIIIGSNKKSH